MNNLRTHKIPVKSLTGEFMTITAGTPVDQALERADQALASAVAVVELIPHQNDLDRESLAYAAAELLYTAQALITSIRISMEEAA